MTFYTEAKAEMAKANQSDKERFIMEQIVENYDATFSIGGVTTSCDFQTSQSVADMYNALTNGRSFMPSITAGNILGAASASGKVLRLKPIKVKLPGDSDLTKTIAPWAFRNLSKWKKVDETMGTSKGVKGWKILSLSTTCRRRVITWPS